MPRKEYLPHAVTPDWREGVRAELAKRPRGAQERMREYIASKGIKCSSGELTDMLNGKAQTSVFVGPIHEFLEWAPPLPPTAARDAGEITHGYLRMTPLQRVAIDRAIDVVNGGSGDQARKALEEMLKALSVDKK